MLKLVETAPDPEVSKAAAATALDYARQAWASSVGDLCGIDVACKLLNSRFKISKNYCFLDCLVVDFNCFPARWHRQCNILWDIESWSVVSCLIRWTLMIWTQNIV